MNCLRLANKNHIALQTCQGIPTNAVKNKKLISTVFFFFILSAGQKTVLTGSVNYTICFGNVYKLKNIHIWGLLVLPFMESSTSTIW